MGLVPFVPNPDKWSANGAAITQTGEIVDLFGCARSVTRTDRLPTRRHDLVQTVIRPISCGWIACFGHRLFRIGFRWLDTRRLEIPRSQQLHRGFDGFGHQHGRSWVENSGYVEWAPHGKHARQSGQNMEEEG